MADELFLITPVNDNFRRDFELADTTLLDPTESDALIQGEWLALNSAGKLARVGASSVRGAMQMFTPKGDFSAQAIGKVSVLQLHEYEAETIVFADGLSPAVGDPLTVKQVTVDGVTRSGLAAAASSDFVYGHVTKTPASNAGKLRFQKSTNLVPLP
jgi:hypothetical protein